MDVYSCLFFSQKTAYEMRISDWISVVCSSDLRGLGGGGYRVVRDEREQEIAEGRRRPRLCRAAEPVAQGFGSARRQREKPQQEGRHQQRHQAREENRAEEGHHRAKGERSRACGIGGRGDAGDQRSEEHTSELQSLMRSSYAGFCLKK